MNTLLRGILCVFFLVFATRMNAQWVRVSTGLPQKETITCLASNGPTLFAATKDSGVYISSDLGQSWLPFNNGFTQRVFVKSLCIYNNKVFASTESGAYTSNISASAWTAIPGFSSIGVNCVHAVNSRLYAGTRSGAYRSIDSGATWQLINNGLPMGIEVTAFAVSGSQLLAAVSGQPLFHSSDNGDSWVSGPSSSLSVQALAVTDSTVMSGAPGLLKISTDEGRSWNVTNSTRAWATTPIFVLAGSYCFSGTQDSGVICSSDKGFDWVTVNRGLEHGWIYSLVVSNGYLFAGTSAGSGTYQSDWGVWRRPLSDFENASVMQNAAPVMQMYPNPATSLVTISNSSQVTVTNMLGATVFDVTSHDRSDITLDVSKLPAGAYFVRSDGSPSIQKLIKE